MHQKKEFLTEESISLWEALREQGIDARLEYNDGYKTVDIALLDSHIYIEVDGLHHSIKPDQILSDFKRAHFSDDDGFDTFYVTNHTIKNHLEEVVKALTEIVDRRNNIKQNAS